ncbi:MAG: hypothetical protein GF411_03380 [Candidatus Lokiarchaeota archaeon]|nr:hypothetical protein [Candidatus Lokiarchaeota archaeon]
MSNTDKLVEVLQKQIEVEKRTLERLIEAEEEARETSVRLVLMEMRLDTWKHQKFLEGMIELMSTVPCDEWMAKIGRYTGRIKLDRMLKEIMKEESEMVKLLEEEIKLMDDEIGLMLLEHLKEDEEKHVESLKRIVTLIKMAPLQPKKGEKGTDIKCDDE